MSNEKTPSLPFWADLPEQEGFRALVYKGVHAQTKENCDCVAALLISAPTSGAGMTPQIAQAMMRGEKTYTLELMVHAKEGTTAYDRLERAGKRRYPDGRHYIIVQHHGLSLVMAELMAHAHAPVLEAELDMASEQDGWGAFTPEGAERELALGASDRLVAAHEKSARMRTANILQSNMEEMKAKIRGSLKR